MDGWTYDRDDLALDEGRQRNKLQVERQVELCFTSRGQPDYPFRQWHAVLRVPIMELEPRKGRDSGWVGIGPYRGDEQGERDGLLGARHLGWSRKVSTCSDSDCWFWRSIVKKTNIRKDQIRFSFAMTPLKVDLLKE